MKNDPDGEDILVHLKGSSSQFYVEIQVLN